MMYDDNLFSNMVVLDSNSIRTSIEDKKALEEYFNSLLGCWLKIYNPTTIEPDVVNPYHVLLGSINDKYISLYTDANLDDYDLDPNRVEDAIYGYLTKDKHGNYYLVRTMWLVNNESQDAPATDTPADIPEDNFGITNIDADFFSVEDISANTARFLRDYEGEYVIIDGSSVSGFDIDEGMCMGTNPINLIYFRYPDVMYELNNYDIVTIYGRVEQAEYGSGINIYDAQLIW